MKRKFYAGAVAVALLSASAHAESMWVKNATVEIRDGKGAVFPAVGTLQKGQEVTVLVRDGNWVQVQAGTVKGWAHTASLSAAKVSGEFSLLPPGAAAAQMNTGIAARGLQGDAEKYVSSRRLNKAPLENLIKLRKSIPPAEYLAFTQQGNVGAK